MNVGEYFSMSSSIYCIRYVRLFAIYFVKQIFYWNLYLFEINLLDDITAI